MSLAERRGGNRSVIPDTTLREAEMSTTQEHSNIPSTAVEFAPGLWRTNLQRHDLTVPGREMIQSRVDVEPDSPPIRHFHPGEEIIYVLEGSLEYQIDGQPAKVYNPGDVLTVPAGVIHAVRNVGTGNAAELATYVVEKGKPLLTVAQ
jgi:quercetin dioxygenase-like cupin family protein